MSGLGESIVAFLDSSISRDENKQRDISLILSHYGFAGAVLPTLEELAERFSIGSRERARQIISENFRSMTNARSLNGIKAYVQEIERTSAMMTSQQMHGLKNRGVLSHDHHPADLMRLLTELDFCADVQLLAPDMRKVTRSNALQHPDFVLIRKSETNAVKQLVKKAHKLPGALGAAKLSDLALDEWAENLMRTLIPSIPGSWTHESEEELWFLFESRENALLNLMKRTFCTGMYCSLDRLATTLHNALHRRAPPGGHEYPPRQIVREYILASAFTSVNEDKVSFSGELLPLTAIEKEMEQFFSTHTETDYPTIRSHLEAAGFGEASIIKAANNSPLVFVEKSGGRTKHRYALAAADEWSGEGVEDGKDRYTIFRDRLKDIARNGTDIDVETAQRREQIVLSQWLFDGCETEKCAICGHEFEVRALVCAHKKPRSICSTSERTDPYIVMPLCLFGCDLGRATANCRSSVRPELRTAQ